MADCKYTRFEIPPSPQAKKCKKKLKDLQPVQEKRRGKRYLSFLAVPMFAVVCFLTVSLAMWISRHDIYGYGEVIGISLILSIFPLFFLAAWYANYEMKLFSLNYQEKLYQTLESVLHEGERFLACSYGKFLHVPDWIEEDAGKFAYFLFTNERLLLVQLDDSIKGIDQATHHLESGTFAPAVSRIYTSPLGDLRNVQYGGFLFPPLLHLFYKRIILCPVGESLFGSWTLAGLCTNNGRQIQRIFNRIENRPDSIQ